MRPRFLLIALFVCSAPAFAGGPKYTKPDAPVPQNWQSPVPWQQANPARCASQECMVEALWRQRARSV